MKTGLVCFDLDDTLIRGIHSVMLPCILNGKEKEHAVIQEQEENGQLDYIAADYLRAELFCGLCEDEIGRHFLEIARPLKGIFETVGFLHEKGVKCLLITVGPVQVARVVCQLYGFDMCYGSDYEVVDGKFTGKIVTYLRAEDKVRCLEDFCRRNCIGSSECVAVGDDKSKNYPIHPTISNKSSVSTTQPASLLTSSQAFKAIDPPQYRKTGISVPPSFSGGGRGGGYAGLLCG